MMFSFKRVLTLSPLSLHDSYAALQHKYRHIQGVSIQQCKHRLWTHFYTQMYFIFKLGSHDSAPTTKFNQFVQLGFKQLEITSNID